MEGMGALVVEAEPVDGIDAIEFDAAGVDEIGECADHALPLEFPFISGACGEAQKRRSPMPVNNDAEFDAQTRRMPAMVFASHEGILVNCGKAVCQRRRPGSN